MKARKSSALTLLGVGWIMAIAGCSGGGGGGVQAPLNVTVSVTQDTSSVQAGGTAHITATVGGDPTNK